MPQHEAMAGGWTAIPVADATTAAPVKTCPISEKTSEWPVQDTPVQSASWDATPGGSDVHKGGQGGQSLPLVAQLSKNTR